MSFVILCSCVKDKDKIFEHFMTQSCSQDNNFYIPKVEYCCIQSFCLKILEMSTYLFPMHIWQGELIKTFHLFENQHNYIDYITIFTFRKTQNLTKPTKLVKCAFLLVNYRRVFFKEHYVHFPAEHSKNHLMVSEKLENLILGT